MEDNSGKKFSLQDWVMKRAANQSGAVVVPPVSARQDIAEQEEVEIREEKPMSLHVEVEMKAVSNGATISAPAVASSSEKEKEKEETPKSRETSSPFSSSSGNPLQQLQIVRLLTDLGDRLRQSEKEREVLWKELEICRKQISDMSDRESKSSKSYSELETQMNQREVFVKELVEKQMGLEQKLKDQLSSIETSKQEQTKLQDKLASIETAAGSAIVRVEDALAENAKLNKRIEQLGQDKVRLARKLEVMEETLTQTQDILKAKALVLLTDQAVAAKTNLPQTPAWTGDDTLKVSTAAAAAVQSKAERQEAGPLSGIAASLKPGKMFQIRPATAMLAGIVLLGIAGGIVGSHYLRATSTPSADEMLAPPENSSEDTDVQKQTPPATTSENTTDNAPAAGTEKGDDFMAQAAKIVSQIEPGNTGDAAEESVAADDGAVLDNPEFAPAQEVQDKAVADFKAAAPTTPLTERIKRDVHLPKEIAAIQDKAFAGDAKAQHDLAAIYTAGHGGVRLNYTRASKWFEESAHNGIANAQYNLAVLYHQGLGVNKDTARAMELYRVAASNNHPEAQYNLGIAYVEGVGTEYNPQVASVYFEQAASGGIVEAAYNLGLLHENGLLGESQPDEAIFWYTLAAQKGNKDAIKALGQLKSQLSMNDEDAARIAEKVASRKPGFADANGKPALPDEKSTLADGDGASGAVSASAPVTAVAPSKIDAKVETAIKKAAATTASAMPKADPVIVSQIQEQLVRLGLYKGQPDGTVSASLTESIKNYQKKSGIKVDGLPSDDLLVNMLASGAETKTQMPTAPQATVQ